MCILVFVTHIGLAMFEWLYRQWCYPMHGWMDMLFVSFITRHSSLCVAFKHTIDTLDVVLHNHMLYLIGLITYMVSSNVRISDEKIKG
jgi:hypothetical protein